MLMWKQGETSIVVDLVIQETAWMRVETGHQDSEGKGHTKMTL